MDGEQNWKFFVICSFFDHWGLLHDFYILVTKLENAGSQEVMFLMNSAIHLLEVCLSFLSPLWWKGVSTGP